MQKRFCSCGQMILVSYRSSDGRWLPAFASGRHSLRGRKNGAALCPGCGSPISIHTLR